MTLNTMHLPFAKTISTLALHFLLISVLVLTFSAEAVGATTGTWIVDDDKPADFHTIQGALDYASEGDTVYVRSGVHYGRVYIEKSVQLVGEDRSTTIIDANSTPESSTEGIYVHWNAKNVVIRGFTVRNGFAGLLLLNDFTVVSNNLITGNLMCGIQMGQGTGDYVIIGNEIVSNWQDGVYMRTVDGCRFYENNFEKNGRCGVWAGDCYGNAFVANTFSSNLYGLSLAEGSANNVVFHNNFINNNGSQAYCSGANVWDDSYPCGGNYWADYAGNDTCSGPYQNVTGSDGIGDAPYAILNNNTDRYPLISLFTPLGDLNLDMRVDSADASILVQAFGSRPPNLDWNPRADLNDDGLVDIYDAILLARNYGRRWM